MEANKLMRYKYDVTASIVLFNSDEDEIKHVIECFLSSGRKTKLYLIDNSKSDILKTLGDIGNVVYIHINKNIGYGAAHNVAIRESQREAKYHLVLNPDVSFSSKVIDQAYLFMEANDDVGLLSPKIVYPDGQIQRMCRLLPTPFDLIARRFLPSFVKSLFKSRLDNYILSGFSYNEQLNIPNLPGSFMFLRNEALQVVGHFDENFFMYLEDIDLTRRINVRYKTIFNPDIEIIHSLDQGSYKSKVLLKYHIESAFYYFKKWGWLIDQDRNEKNNAIIKEISK